MDIDVNKAVGAAQDALGAVAKDENAKKVANGAIDAVEKKVGVDQKSIHKKRMSRPASSFIL